MVVKRKWRVVSGTMAAGAILAPSTAMAFDGLPALHDVVPYVADSPTTEEATFYQRIVDGLPVNFDFETALSAASVASEASAESVASEASAASVGSEPSAGSDASEPSAGSEASQPSAPSAPSGDSELSADDSF